MGDTKHIVLVIVCLVTLGVVLSDDTQTCQAGDFHHVYTECDAEGGRWRVSVPKPEANCQGGAPNPPIRGQSCQFTCEEGKYLDIEDDKQECKQCPAGTYSMGGGVRFDDWDHLPTGFSAKSEPFSPVISTVLKTWGDYDESGDNCTRAGWLPSGKYISSLASECSATLQYTANLVKPGEVRFLYQYTDDEAIFHFTIQNSECQSVEDKKRGTEWPEITNAGEWRTVTAELKSGINVLYWKTIGISENKGARPKPIKIKKIEISGIAFTQECSKCPSGTFSKEGASMCQECKANQYSKKGSTSCTGCDANKEYSEAGAAECTQRPLCTADDYFEYNSPCDENRKTKVMYKWIQPKICAGGVDLPPSGNLEDCSPCNPGMQVDKGTCEFCDVNEFSDGSGECKECPPSTAPEYSLQYKWWQNIPVEGNLSASCLSLTDRGCASEVGWQESPDHIHSGKGHADDAYLVLSVQVGGFRGKEQVISGKAASVGEVSFVFELECTSECTFYFMQQTKNGGTSVIETWTGKQEKQKYTYKITKNEEVSFSWAFQKLSTEDTPTSQSQFNLKDDHAKIYSINVTNTLGGGASSCKACPKGTSKEGCIPCPKGQYIDSNTTKCLPCPAGFIVRGDSPWGVESCVPCGEGLTAKDGVECVSTCQYKNDDREYDFSALGAPAAVEGTRLFTSSGTQYYHLFNISLCSETKVGCVDNITAKALRNQTSADDERLYSTVCRTTILPPKPGDNSDVLSAQPVSLGDYLVMITSDVTKINFKEDQLANEGWPEVKDGSDNFDVHFLYKSETPTAACRDGRSTVITLRCDVGEDENGTVLLPPKCPDGTCDGCNFHFLWKTQVACPICKEQEYKEVIGQCVAGEQEVHYIPPKHCVLLSENPELIKKQKCSVLPFWLQVSILAAGGVGFLLIILVIYCWKKNRKLEYKYMKLVGTSGKDGELPVADSCGLSEEEDEEDTYDKVHFKKKGSVLHKFMGGGRDDQQIMLSEEEEI